MKIYTIGFTQKTAETFFELLHTNNIQYLVDIRVHPSGQLAAFARQEDLPYFLDRLADHCGYIYLPDLAPTKEMMKEYRSGRDWPRYKAGFERLMDERGIPDTLDRQFFESLIVVYYAVKQRRSSAIGALWLNVWPLNGVM